MPTSTISTNSSISTHYQQQQNQQQKPEYRDYVNFLGSYSTLKRNGSNAAKENNSLPVPYSSYLETAKTKKFTPIVAQPSQNGTANTIVRSEIFIQINGDSAQENKKSSHNEIRKVVNIVPAVLPATVQGAQVKIGEKISLFEEKTQDERRTPQKPSIITTAKTFDEVDDLLPPPPPPLPSVERHQQNSNHQICEFIQREIEANCSEQPLPPPPPPSMLEFEQKTFVVPVKSTTKNSSTVSEKPVIKTQKPTNGQTLDKNDPRVKKLVYNTLRGMYGAYHERANGVASTTPGIVASNSQNGVQKIINHMAQQSEQLPGTTFGLESSTYPTRNFHHPVVRLKTKIPERIMEPPACVQNAMLKQDKKPFTYTPGGINLSEIRSPRMARRIERNANTEGTSHVPPPSPQINHGPLPPAALAAMQPQMHVQVFPTGSAPIPPPPPPPAPLSHFSNSSVPPPPPPPPPPQQHIPSLPTQKVVTSDNQVVERPDMTKIIPENPMTLLRKTGGPRPQQTPSFMDELSNVTLQQTHNRPTNQQSVPTQQFTTVQPQTRPVPPHQIRQTPVEHHTQPQPKPVQQWSPPIVQNNNQKQGVQSPQFEEPPTIKTSTANVGSLYIPPLNQHHVTATKHAAVPSPPPVTPQRVDSPKIQSPVTPPTLKEAPKPWQRQPQTQDIPPWVGRRDPQQPNTVHYEVDPVPGHNYQESAPNAVYVTQPMVLQHPGALPPQFQNQYQQAPPAHIRVGHAVPAQVEGTRNQWNNNGHNNGQVPHPQPIQSNSFRVIQKITDAEENGGGKQTHQSYPNQHQGVEQMRKLKLSEDDQELMSRFKQVLDEENPRYRGGLIPSKVFRLLDASGVDEEVPLHTEIDPRYRGAAIPSKAFKLLQTMTAGDGEGTNVCSPSSSSSTTVPRGNSAPKVRNIPIQIERDEPEQYVHPSQQTVPEPRKYTGSSIPGRSFKILQAMTAPDNCANANEVNENYDDSSTYPFPYPYYPPHPAYWRGYYPPPPMYYYPLPPPTPPPPNTMQKQQDSEQNEEPEQSWWINYWNNYEQQIPHEQMTQNLHYQYPPFWDPYYYAYYYGYPHPPIYPSYSFYSENNEANNESENISEENSVQNSSPPEIVITSNLEDENDSDSSSSSDEETEKIEESPRKRDTLPTIKSVTDIKVYDNDEDHNDTSDEEEELEEEIEEEEENENTDEELDIINTNEEETIPHQLSVIFEVSECTDISYKREASVTSDSTTVAEDNQDYENDSVFCDDANDNDTEEEVSTTICVKLPIRKVQNADSVEDLTASYTLSQDHVVNEENVDTTEVKKRESVSSEEDWWGIINKDEDDVGTYRKQSVREVFEEVDSKIEESENEILCQEEETEAEIKTRGQFVAIEEDACSTSSNDSSSSSERDAGNYFEENEQIEEAFKDIEQEQSKNNEEVFGGVHEVERKECSEESSESSDSLSESSDEEPDEIPTNTSVSSQSTPDEPKMLTVGDRIKALKDAIAQKQKRFSKDQDIEIKTTVKQKIEAIESINPDSLTIKRSEQDFIEECDSGVTSDVSRHDIDEVTECRKSSTQYQRAATHSRLYKLLNGEETDEEDDEHISNSDQHACRDQLSLPLIKNGDADSFSSSSGFASPTSPASESTNQGNKQRYKYSDTDFGGSTELSTAAQTPQEFYSDYKQYYESWCAGNEDYDILPSKAFKILKENGGKSLEWLAKCPKVLSAKNIHQELLKLAENNESDNEENSLDPSNSIHNSKNEVTSTT